MKYYRINYIRTRNWIDYKVVKTEIGESDAIRKTKLNPSRITEVFEITHEEFETYRQKIAERKEAEEQRRAQAFIV